MRRLGSYDCFHLHIKLGEKSVSAVARLRQMLSEAGITYAEEPGRIAVKPDSANGFEVLLLEEPELTVYFDGWHEHFEDEAEAVRCFMFGLSSECRLSVVCA